MSGVLYLERLSDQDLALLARAAGEPESVSDRLAELRASPHRIEPLLASPETFEALFARPRRDPFLLASPFLVFSVIVGRCAQDLATVRFVREQVGPRHRVPVFDGKGLHDFAADPLRKLFLADLLASYTHVASGSVWVKTSRGWRRRRFSELDPVRLAEVAEAAPEPERPGLYRRLGDVALFLAGVFPDHVNQRLFSPLGLGRLERALRSRPIPGGADERDPKVGGTMELLEWIGRRSYHLAWEATNPRDLGLARVLNEVAGRFGQARRTLNFLTERYLFPRRDQWFRPPAA